MVEGQAVVSQAEYDRMLSTYAAIRSGDSHLVISDLGMDEDEAKAYKAAVLDNLTTMMQTEAGRHLVDELANQHHLDEVARKDIVISNGLASYEEAAAKTASSATGASRATRRRRASRGWGPARRVFWANEDRTLTDENNNPMPMPKDAVLFHEMTHALHNLRGTRDPDRVEKGDGVPADVGALREEHQTIGLGVYEGEYVSENTYRAQRRALAAGVPTTSGRRSSRTTGTGTSGASRPARGELSDTNGKRKYGEGGWPVK